VSYVPAKAAQLLKSTCREIHSGALEDSHFQSLYHYNSASDCSISLKFGREFDHVTADTLQVFKVNGSKVKVRW